MRALEGVRITPCEARGFNKVTEDECCYPRLKTRFIYPLGDAPSPKGRRCANVEDR